MQIFFFNRELAQRSATEMFHTDLVHRALVEILYTDIA